MTGSDADRLVDDYLERLDAALDALPTAQAAELVDEIDAHIAAARAELPGGGSEAELRTLLDRLGSPAEIARGALDEEPAARRLRRCRHAAAAGSKGSRSCCCRSAAC